jgi:hypothetical protein
MALQRLNCKLDLVVLRSRDHKPGYSAPAGRINLGHLARVVSGAVASPVTGLACFAITSRQSNIRRAWEDGMVRICPSGGRHTIARRMERLAHPMRLETRPYSALPPGRSVG